MALVSSNYQYLYAPTSRPIKKQVPVITFSCVAELFPNIPPDPHRVSVLLPLSVLFALLSQKTLLCNCNTITKTKFGIYRR
jgi:hypothetical protein